MIEQLLTLKTSSDNDSLLAHHHYTNPNGSLFGGLLVAQSLMAVSHRLDVNSRLLHSLHAYFINRGDALNPIEYSVKTIREGRSFTAMNTIACQNDKDIFMASMSFQTPEDNGVNHVTLSADIEAPTQADLQRTQHYRELAKSNPSLQLLRAHKNDYFDIVTTKDNPGILYQDGTARGEFWIKLKDKAHIDVQKRTLHQACLMLVSDMGVLYSTLAPYKFDPQQTAITSIDHNVWLHEPDVNLNEWHFVKAHSVWAANSRTLIQAEIYDQAGHVVATIAQEGLVRTTLLS